METKTAQDLITECTKLKASWSTRDKKIKDWYKILTMEDKYKQEGMESVVGNDPKTGYNLGKHLLISSIISHNIDNTQLSPTQITATSYVEDYIHRRWKYEDDRYRKAGRQRFMSKLVGFMLSTGWYAVFSMPMKDGIINEIWNPIECFPEFSTDGLSKVVHIYTMSPSEANRKIKTSNWSVKDKITNNVQLYDYWGFDDDGDIVHSIILDKDYVIKPEKDVYVNRMVQKTGQVTFPVFISPVGGLPDEGSILTGKKWQEWYGESIVATNEQLTDTYNKMLTFIQQTARNAAQPRYYEKSSTDSEILTEENMSKWGAIFRLVVNDDIGIMDSPEIPVELRTALFEYSNMIQRGSFPWVLHGNIQQQLSYLAMANVASSAMQQLTPFIEGLEGVLTDVDNFWLQMMLANNFKPYNFDVPGELPEEFNVDVNVEIQIPGYTVQRATVASMLNPSIKLPHRWIIDRMFPEITDALRTQAQVREEDALNHPKAIMVDAILAYRQHAKRMSDSGDRESARLYEKLATSMEAELGIAQGQSQGGEQYNNPISQSILREVMPEEGNAPLQGLGGDRKSVV
jgi:hypothetical protein